MSKYFERVYLSSVYKYSSNLYGEYKKSYSYI